MLSKLLIRISNLLTRLRCVRVDPENLVMVVPHCLQWNECPQNIVQDIKNCKRCGKCRIKDLYDLSNKYGIRCVVCSGGRQATAAVRQKDVKAVVAVACHKELALGLLVTFPKPILAVHNQQPCGFCINTTVEAKEVEEAVRSMLKKTPEEDG